MENLSNLKSTDTLPWIEKYRPKSLDEVISQGQLVETLRNFIQNKKFPHLLFHGPSGTGKTSVIMACARELYGKNFSTMVMSINASEERGIEVVRNAITQFSISKNFVFDEESLNMFKLVILDEADAMTLDAQASLRRVIEKYTKTVRFCLICNYINKINVAIQSRCVCFRFLPLRENYIRGKVKDIIELEHIKITPEGINSIIKRSDGDMRKVLNVLQSISIKDNENIMITDEHVNNYLSYPSPQIIKDIINSLVNDNFKNTYLLIKNYKKQYGYSLIDIIKEVHSVLISNLLDCEDKLIKINVNEGKYGKIFENLRDIEFNTTNSINDNIQLGAFVGIFKFYCLQ